MSDNKTKVNDVISHMDAIELLDASTNLKIDEAITIKESMFKIKDFLHILSFYTQKAIQNTDIDEELFDIIILAIISEIDKYIEVL